MRKPGIYADIDIDEYHQEEGISSTGVSLILDCPARYRHEYTNKDVPAKDNKAYTIGRAVHMAALEPDKFDQTFYFMQDAVDLRTTVGRKAYADAKTAAGTRQVIRSDEMQEILDISQAIKNHPVWAKIGAGKAEQSIYWDCPLFGTRLRSRPDFFNDRIVIDIKTTESIKNFPRSIMNYGYHRQAAMQIDGLKSIDGVERLFAYFVVEKRAPYLTACYTLDEMFLNQGRREYQDATLIYNECMQTGQWPGYETQFQLISLPAWALEKEV
jgi:hypothetical protein